MNINYSFSCPVFDFLLVLRELPILWLHMESQLSTVEAKMLDTYFPNPSAAYSIESELHCVQSQDHGGSLLVCGGCCRSGFLGRFCIWVHIHLCWQDQLLATELCALWEPEDVSAFKAWTEDRVYLNLIPTLEFVFFPPHVCFTVLRCPHLVYD